MRSDPAPPAKVTMPTTSDRLRVKLPPTNTVSFPASPSTETGTPGGEELMVTLSLPPRHMTEMPLRSNEGRVKLPLPAELTVIMPAEEVMVITSLPPVPLMCSPPNRSRT